MRWKKIFGPTTIFLLGIATFAIADKFSGSYGKEIEKIDGFVKNPDGAASQIDVDVYKRTILGGTLYITTAIRGKDVNGGGAVGISTVFVPDSK